MHAGMATHLQHASGSNELSSSADAASPTFKVKTGNLLGQFGVKAGRSDVSGHQLVTVPAVGGVQSHGQGSRHAYARWH